MLFSESLKKYGDFQRVYKRGRSYANKYLIMYVLKQDVQENRIGISVSKKVGNSVVRHRITRLIRESYRLNEQKFVGALIIGGDCKGRARKNVVSLKLRARCFILEGSMVFGNGEKKKK